MLQSNFTPLLPAVLARFWHVLVETNAIYPTEQSQGEESLTEKKLSKQLPQLTLSLIADEEALAFVEINSDQFRNSRGNPTCNETGMELIQS